MSVRLAGRAGRIARAVGKLPNPQEQPSLAERLGTKAIEAGVSAGVYGATIYSIGVKPPYMVEKNTKSQPTPNSLKATPRQTSPPQINSSDSKLPPTKQLQGGKTRRKKNRRIHKTIKRRGIATKLGLKPIR